jgi:hypothetical protein
VADIGQVADTLAALIGQAIYPTGENGLLSRVSPDAVPAAGVIVYQGWPDATSLENDLAVGKVHVSLFPRPGDTTTSVMMGDGDWQEAVNDGTRGISAREVRRQTRQIQITIWAPDPAVRDALASDLDTALAVTSRFMLPDGSQAVLSYVNSAQSDEQQKLTIYRRDLFYAVSYAVVQTEAEFSIKQTVANVTAGPTSTVAGPQISLTIP